MAKGIYISPLPVLKFSLQAFVVIRPFFCAVKHKMRNGMCKDCTALVKLLSWWIQNVWSKLVPLFPLINYKADQAVRKLMQMPVTVVEMCLKGPGSQKLYVLESIPGVNVGKLVAIAEKCLSKSSPRAGISKEMLQDLCNLATAESDRLLIKYACCKGQMLSKKQSIAFHGFHDFNHQEEKINNAITEQKEMFEAVELLGKVKDKAILQGLGLSLSSDESSSVGASSSGSETHRVCMDL